MVGLVLSTVPICCQVAPGSVLLVSSTGHSSLGTRPSSLETMLSHTLSEAPTRTRRLFYYPTTEHTIQHIYGWPLRRISGGLKISPQLLPLRRLSLRLTRGPGERRRKTRSHERFALKYCQLYNTRRFLDWAERESIPYPASGQAGTCPTNLSWIDRKSVV